jgi:hypothetical protein
LSEESNGREYAPDKPGKKMGLGLPPEDVPEIRNGADHTQNAGDNAKNSFVISH